MNASPAIGAERADYGAAAVRGARKGLEVALEDPKRVFGNDHTHSERAAGLTLALRAMADSNGEGLTLDLVTNDAALAAALTRIGHGSNPPQRMVTGPGPCGNVKEPYVSVNKRDGYSVTA